MSRIWSIRVLGAVVVLAAAAPVAAADGEGLYLGAGGGRAEIQDAGDHDTGKKAFIGYDFSKNFGIEAGFVDLGRQSVDGIPVEADGPTLDAVINLPFNDGFALFAKGGAHRLDVETADISERESDTHYGAGLKVAFNRNVALRGEWERFETDARDTDLVSASLVFMFR